MPWCPTEEFRTRVKGMRRLTCVYVCVCERERESYSYLLGRGEDVLVGAACESVLACMLRYNLHKIIANSQLFSITGL